MDKFSQTVKKCREKESDLMLDNASFDHALVLCENLLGAAKDHNESVRIVTGSLAPVFYDKLIGAVTAYLKSEDAKIDVIVIDPCADMANSEFAKVLEDDKRCNLYVSKNKVAYPHFMLIGEKRFRLETDHNKIKAKACFNNPNLGRFLSELFSDIIKCSILQNKNNAVAL